MTAAPHRIETEGDRLEREAREALEEFVAATDALLSEQERRSLTGWTMHLFTLPAEAFGPLTFYRTDPQDPPPR